MEAENKFPMLLNLTVNDKTVVFKASIDYTISLSLAKWTILQVKSPQLCRPFTPEHGEMCPKVKLLKHEVESVMKNHPRAEELFWVHNKEDINGSVFVCCNNYILNQTSLSSVKFHLSSVITLFIIIFPLTRTL
jgi:hypothetical protein